MMLNFLMFLLTRWCADTIDYLRQLLILNVKENKGANRDKGI